MEYVAMARTAAEGPELAAYMKGNGAKTLLCLNECDISDQANMSVDQAVAFYRKYCNPLAKKGYKVIAPAISNGVSNDKLMGLAFLDSFLKKCTGCKIDGVNIHWYGPKLGDFKRHISTVINKYSGKGEIWVTEFGLEGGKISKSFLQGAIDYLDKRKEITRYAYFGAFTNGKGMLDANGKLNSFGKIYKA